MPAKTNEAPNKIEEEITLDGLTFVSEEKKPDYTGPYVNVFIPALDDSGSNGVKVDQYEHVTIANEAGEKLYRVHRGENVMVPVPVFEQLKKRYPNC